MKAKNIEQSIWNNMNKTDSRTVAGRCEKHHWQNAFPGDNTCPYCEAYEPKCECLNPHIHFDANCPKHAGF